MSVKTHFSAMTRRRAIKGALATGATALAPLSARAQDAWATTVEAAKKEKSVVLYTALVGDPTLKAITQAFTAKYGIAVEILEGRGSDLRERQRVEQAAGRFLSDVTFTSEGQARLIAREDKSYVTHEATPNLKSLKPDFAKYTDGGLFAPTMTIAYGMLANTNVIKPEDMPRKWADLADSKWKGKILSDDTRAIGGGYLMFFAQLDAPSLGEKFHEALAKNEPSFTRDMREAGRRVARGEYPLYIPFILTDIVNLKGLPVKPIIPEEGCPFVLYGNAMSRNAPHPNAARLYIDYWLSEEAQLMWAKTGMGVVRAGLDDKVPAEVRVLANAKLMGTSDPDRQDAVLAAAKRIYK
jgi:iron(III) transport system substrate-binding protein